MWYRTTDLKWYIPTYFMFVRLWVNVCSVHVSMWLELLGEKNERQKGILSVYNFFPHPPAHASLYPHLPASMCLSGFTLILRHPDEISFYARINCHKWWQLWRTHFIEYKCVQINFKDKTVFSPPSNFRHPCAVSSFWLNYRFFVYFLFPYVVLFQNAISIPFEASGRSIVWRSPKCMFQAHQNWHHFFCTVKVIWHLN